MMEPLLARAESAAAKRVRKLRAELAERIEAALPADIKADLSEDGVRLTGRGLVRRMVLDPHTRWIARGIIG